jgi:hypothetical protein
MKQTLPLTLALVLCMAAAFAQPQTIPYQAVARDVNGNLLSNAPICIQFGIYDAASGGTLLYKEHQTVTTNKLGLFSVNVGTGTYDGGANATLGAINWGASGTYMDIGLNIIGTCSGYTPMGRSQMMSVPYALYAASAASVPLTSGTGISVSGDQISSTGVISVAGSGVISASGTNPATVSLTGTVPIANGGTGLTATPANGQIDIGNGTGFTRTTITAGSGITVTNSSGGITVANSAPSSGGTVTSISTTAPITGGTITGSGTIGLGTVGIGNGGTGITATPTNGQIDIGNGTNFTRATLTAGSNINITNSAGAITIAATGLQPTLTTGNLTDAGTDGITVTSGTGAVIGSGTSIAQQKASASANGYLSSTDWTTFNSKQAALTAGTGITLSGSTISETLPFTSLTTTGTSGAATISGGVLNIPNYALAGPIGQVAAKASFTTNTQLLSNNTGSYANGAGRGWTIGTWQDVPSLTVTSTVPTGKYITVSFSIDGYGNDYSYYAPQYVVFRLVRDGVTELGKAGAQPSTNGTYYYVYWNCNVHTFDFISDGASHTWKVQYYMSNDFSTHTESVFIEDSNITVSYTAP